MAIGGEIVSAERVQLVGNRHRIDAPDQALERGDESMRVLGLHHAPDEMHRARHALVELGKRMRDDLSASGVVSAIEPDFGAVRHVSMERAGWEALEPRRPLRVRQPVLERAKGERVAEHDAGSGDGRAGIVDLMAAREPRQGEIDEARGGLEDEPPMLLEGVEIAAGDVQRRADLLCPSLDHVKRLMLLTADHARNAGFQNARPSRRRSPRSCRRERRRGRSRSA